MIENLKELFNSEDEGLVKQGIELLLSLKIEEKEINQALGFYLNDSHPSLLKWSKERFEEIFKGIKENEALLEACFLALLKASGQLKSKCKTLRLKANPYFDDFDLLNDLEGITELELIGFEWRQIQYILKSNPQVTTLKLVDRLSIDWSEGVEIFSNQLNALSLSWIDLKTFFNEAHYTVLLPLLEKGMGVHQVEEIEEVELLFKECKIDFGNEKKRWLRVLQHIRFDVDRDINGVGFNLVYCPPGEFWMGSTEEKAKYVTEKPRHRVKLSKGFWMSIVPVTQELWERVMGENPSQFSGSTRPVERVNWFDCVRFCNQLSQLEGLRLAYSIGGGDRPTVEWNKNANGYRLPFEAEWEYVAKAGAEFIYAGSDHLDEVGWCYYNSRDQTEPVGQKKPNAWGFYDLSGNCDEWCNDSWDSDAYKNRTGITVDPYVYQSDPAGRVFRGGCWEDSASDCHVAGRGWFSPGASASCISFRLLRQVCSPYK